MKTLTLPVALALIAVLALMSACGGNKSVIENPFPENFSELGDIAQVDFIMKNSTPDSVARFICNAALGKVNNARIDTLASAVSYAYVNYNDSALIIFSREFEDFAANLPLGDKMKIYSMAGKYDPQGLGYELGLEYVNHIRECRMTVKDIRNELEAFRTACADDSVTYQRFLKGFKTVLRLDHGKDLPEDVYTAFIDY